MHIQKTSPVFKSRIEVIRENIRPALYEILRDAARDFGRDEYR
jgi:hypothetical protein